MKTTPSPLPSIVRAATLGLGLLFIANPADAQVRTWERRSDRSDFNRFDNFGDNIVMRRYHSSPRSSFSLSFGTGYAGRGYYLGPPGSGYYYRRPGVMFFRSWDTVPYEYRRYSYAPRNGNVIAVQQALARLGYYRGRVDGSAGPGTRGAIMRFEERNGMPVTGVVSPRLLRALNIY